MRSALLRCDQHHAFDRNVEVSFGGYAFGASRAPEIFLGASNSRDSRRIHWDCALVVRTHRESTVSRQTLRAVFFPAARLVCGTPNVRTIGDGNRGHVASVRWTSPCWTIRLANTCRSAPHFDRCRSGDRHERTRAESRAPASGRVAVGGRRTTPSTRPATWLDVGTGADWTQEHRRSDHRLLHRSRRISRQPYCRTGGS